MNNIIISNIEEKDVAKIVEFGRNAKELQIDDELNQYYGEDDFKKAIKDEKNICLKAMSDGKLVGFIFILFHDYFKELYISDIFVIEEFRGQGIGSRLLDEAMKKAKEFNPQWGWALVQTENTNMQKFLERKGLKKGKSFYFYYTNTPLI